MVKTKNWAEEGLKSKSLVMLNNYPFRCMLLSSIVPFIIANASQLSEGQAHKTNLNGTIYSLESIKWILQQFLLVFIFPLKKIYLQIITMWQGLDYFNTSQIFFILYLHVVSISFKEQKQSHPCKISCDY